jgi:hypothetical protein
MYIYNETCKLGCPGNYIYNETCKPGYPGNVHLK